MLSGNDTQKKDTFIKGYEVRKKILTINLVRTTDNATLP